MTRSPIRETAPGVHVVRLPRDGLTELFITISAVDGEAPAEMFARLDGCMQANQGSRILRKDVLGLTDAGDGPVPSYRANGAEWPVTWVRQGSPRGCPVAGIHVHAVEGVAIEPVRIDGRIVGNVFEDSCARYCVLGDLRAADASLPREAQARLVFEMMEESLKLAGMDFSNTVRTWLYIRDILDWYREFNVVRTTFFGERGVFDRMVPASTGIGGTNPAGAAVVANLLAVEPKDGNMRIEPVPSPLQCPALEYGSSFSRAVEVRCRRQRRLFVSGTASISPDGRTAHVGDVDAQVDLTMEVVYAILKARGMDWADVTRAIAYFKVAEDAPAFDRYCARKGLPAMPVVIAQNDICRDELLYEIEADAVVLD